MKTLLGSRDLVPIPFSSMGPGTRPRFFELVFPRDLGYVEGGLVVATRIARLHNSQSRVTIPRGVYIYVIGGPSKTTFGTFNLLVFFSPPFYELHAKYDHFFDLVIRIAVLNLVLNLVYFLSCSTSENPEKVY